MIRYPKYAASREVLNNSSFKSWQKKQAGKSCGKFLTKNLDETLLEVSELLNDQDDDGERATW